LTTTSERVAKKLINDSPTIQFIVCVKEKEKVLDGACIEFARLFYQALFKGQSVQSAMTEGSELF
jgi:hypothetical protein